MTPHESYYDRIRDSKNPGAIRRAMVEFYPWPALARPVPWPKSYQDGPNPTGSSLQDPEGRDGRPGVIARPIVTVILGWIGLVVIMVVGGIIIGLLGLGHR